MCLLGRDYVPTQCCRHGFDGCLQVAPKVCTHRLGTAGCHELCGHTHARYRCSEEPAQVDGAERSRENMQAGPGQGSPRCVGPEDTSFQSPLVFRLVWLLKG